MIALPTPEARTLLASAGVSFPGWTFVTTAAEARAFAGGRDGPFALKTAAGDVVHKSDAGCVVLNARGADEAERAYEKIASNAARAGSITPGQVLVEEMVAGVVELAVGLKRDSTFGPVVMAGLGGVWVEVMRDVALRLCPVTETEARDMLRGLEGFALLDGARGTPRADLRAISRLVAAVSRLGISCPEILELDLNPVIAQTHGAIAVDARIFIEGPPP